MHTWTYTPGDTHLAIHPRTHFNVLSIFPRVALAKVDVYTSKSDTRVDFRPRGTARSKKGEFWEIFVCAFRQVCMGAANFSSRGTRDCDHPSQHT